MYQPVGILCSIRYLLIAIRCTRGRLDQAGIFSLLLSKM